jgi:glyoxylase-like metal-dependent hydrolase (beta-lactamase superfamily II)/rhodanese-related sulfurtransferase
MASSQAVRNELDAAELYALLAQPNPRFVLLDVRNDEEFRTLEGRQDVTTIHTPYFDYIEDEDAHVIAMAPYRERKVVVVCAKGGSSAYVAELLRQNGFEALNLTGGMLAWGELLVPVRVPTREGLVIQQIQRPGKGCVSYLIVHSGGTLVVDAARASEFYIELARGFGRVITHVVDTHLHADHLSGGRDLADKAGARYLLSALDVGGGNLVFEPLLAGDTLGSDGTLATVETPGHTPGSMSILVDGTYMLSGDFLFVASVGRPDLANQLDAWGRALFRTLATTLSTLPDETLVLPAHYGGRAEVRPDGVVAGTLGAIRRSNESLQSTTEDDFLVFLRAHLTAAPATYQEIRQVNQQLLVVDKARATELEIGKNECAASHTAVLH